MQIKNQGQKLETIHKIEQWLDSNIDTLYQSYQENPDFGASLKSQITQSLTIKKQPK